MSTPPVSPDGSVDGGARAPIAVLHVDDNPSVVELSADLLERESDAIVVETETSASAALDRLRTDDIDCVVSDHDMPGTTGIEFLEAVRAEHGDLPFVLFTGKGSEEIASEAISAGVTDYLQKEAGSDQYAVLANRIENAVEQHRTRQALERERTRRSALFENAPDPIMETEIVDGSLVISTVNESFEEVFGHTADEVVGQTVAELLIPDASSERYDGLRRRVVAGEPIETEVERETADDTREFRLRAIPITSREGTPDGDYAWYTDITERKRRDRRIDALTNAFPDLAFVIDEDGRHVELLASPTSESLLYTDPDAIVGQRFHDVFPPERADEFLSVIHSTLETGRPQTLEYELDVRAGTRWLEARTAPLSTEIDGKRAVTWVSRDVTERTEREGALRGLHDIATRITSDDSKEAVCRRTIATAEDILEFDQCVIDMESDGELWVAACSESVSADETTTMSIDEGLAGKTFRTGESFIVDDVRTHEDAKPQGSYRAAISVPVGDHGVFQAVAEEPGAFDDDDLELAEILVSHVALAIDRLEHARTLQRNQRRFEAVFDNPLSFIGLLEPDGTLIDANRTALELIDRSAEDVVGDTMWETPWWTHSSEQQARLREWISRAADGEYVRFEADHSTANAGEVVVDGVLHPVEDDGGDLAEIMIAARDVTDAKERARDLELQNERLDEFTRIVSHDLRNPLNVLQGSIELAEETGDPDDFDRCRRAADRMEALVDDLLMLARTGSSIDERRTVDLAEIVESCWETVDTGAARLVIDTDATLRADPGRFRQLLENLFRNAVEHGSTSPRSSTSREDAVEHGSTSPDSQARQDAVEHGSTSPRSNTTREDAAGACSGESSVTAAPEVDGEAVTVTVGDLERATGFYVEDDGTGIPPNERERVFESGYSSSPDGTGFGLSIAEQIVDAHDWGIGVTAGESGGARFEIETGNRG